MKLIIDIPKEAYNVLLTEQVWPHIDVEWLIMHGTPLDDVKAEIKEKCDRIDDISRENIYQYAQHREIQELLREILASIDKVGSEENNGKET